MKKIMFALLVSTAVLMSANPCSAQAPKIRIMPLGDSITYGANSDGIGGGYRYPLYVALTNAGYNVDYIGTQTSIPHAGLGAEINHEGHSGWKISDPTSGLYENILGWFASVGDPDVILLHIGTNDSGTLSTFSNAVDRLDALITRMAVAKPNAHIIVTSLLKRSAPNYTNITNLFNPYVPGKVSAQAALGRRVTFLDMHAKLELSDMYDNLHPNNAGYGKMAAAWFPAITNIVTPYGDFVPPAVASIRAPAVNTLTVTFSKPINLAASPAITNPASWTVSPAGTVTAVTTLSADLLSVTLAVSGLDSYAVSTLAFTGTITDLVPPVYGGPFSTSLSGTVGAFAVSGARAWTGLGADALWSTLANWTGYTVPTATETVLFTGAGNNKTNLTLGTGATAAGLTFAADASAYSLGLASETLTLAANAPLTLSAGSANNQSVAASLLVGGNLNVYNYEPSKSISLSYTNNTNREIYLRGTGPVTFNTIRRAPAQEETDTNYIRLESRINAPLTFTERMTIGALWSYDYPINLTFASHTTNIFCRNDWNFAINFGGSINGEGAALRIVPSDAAKRARVAIQTYRVDMNVQLIAPKGFETTGGWTRGTLVLNHPDNDIQGTLALDRGNCLEVAFLANNGTPNPLGACTNVMFVNPLDTGIYARLRVTGAAASSTDKAFSVDKDRGVIENAGTGTLALTGAVTGAGTLAFDAFGNMTFSGIRSGTGGLAKTGAGTLTLTTANTHTGTNFVEAGTLALLPGASIGTGTLILSGGLLALNPAAADSYSVTLPALTFTAPSALSVPAAATSSSVTFTSVTTNGNMLVVTAPAAGTAANRIFFTGLAEGSVDWIVLNNGPATYSFANGLAPLSLPAAAIVNDILPDAAGSAATAVAPPATSFSIASSLTTLGMFDYTAASPATLDLGGNILALNYLSADAPLAVINGTLTAPGATTNVIYPGLRTISIVPLTSDASTGLSTAKTYSHLIDFGNQSPATINGVVFTQGAANGTGTGYSGFPNGNVYDNFNSWTNNLPPATCSGLLQFLRDMNYNGNFTAQVTGLTPGAVYEIRLYFRAWDAPPSTQERRSLYQFYSASSSFPDASCIYASQPNTANAVVYRYLAPASGILKFAVTAVANNVASGCFGFSNEQLASAAGTPPSSGSIVLSGPLAISAALTDNGGPTALVASGSDPLTLTGPVSLTGSVRFETPTTLAPAAGVTQAFNGAVSGSESLTVNGLGTVVFRAPNPGLSGPVAISNGVLEIANSLSLGAALNPSVIVASGGALAIGQAFNNTITLSKSVILSGSGPDGNGALRYDNDAQQYPALTSIILADDATIGGNGPSTMPTDGTRGRFDIRNGILDFAGHSLVKAGPSAFIVTSSSITGVTDSVAIDIAGGVFGLELTSDLKGSAANTLTVRPGTSFDLNQLVNPLRWTVVFTNQARLTARNSATTSQNLLTGPVTLLSGATILDGPYNDTISGVISGSGGLLKAAGVTRLLSTNNSYAGTTVVTNGILFALSAGTLPAADFSRVTVANTGVLAVRPAGSAGGQIGWSNAEIGALASSGAFLARSTALGFETVYEDNVFSGALPIAGVAKFGTRKQTIDSATYNMGAVTVYDGELSITAAPHFLGTNSITLGANLVNYVPGLTTLSLTGPASLLTSDLGYNVAGPIVSLGAVNASRSILTLDGNAAISGRLYLGSGGGNAEGAVYQTGGSFLNTGGSANDGRAGINGHGYYDISGGTFTNKGYTQFGVNLNNAGILRQTGGSVVFNSGTVPGTGVFGDYYNGFLSVRAGLGLFHLSGGTLTTGASKFSLGEWDTTSNGGNDGTGILTLEGTANASVGFLELANRNGSVISIMNLNGGNLATRYLVKGGNNNSANARAFVNFNGGNLRITENGAAIRTSANNSPAVLGVSDGGASIEVATNLSVTLDLPLTAIEGQGLSFIGISSPGAGYIAPPFVNITGGGGYGASAVATIDRVTGLLASIRITSTGTGYTSVPTVTLVGGGYTTIATVRDVAIGMVSSIGGLTKRGPGTLTLTTNNTFRGTVTVLGGILAVRSPGAIPQGANFVLDGGILDLGGYTLTNASVTLSSGGAIVNGSVVTADFRKDGAGSADLAARVTPREVDLAAAIRAAKRPGLREYRLNGASVNTNALDTAVFGPVVQFSTRALLGNTNSLNGSATLNGALWPDNSVYVYTGYLWNKETTNVTWTFMQNMDDTFLMRLDGAVILNKGFTTILPYRITANAGTCSTITLTPGPHAIEIRAGQGGGGVGGYWIKSDGSRPVWGIDRLGRDVANVEYCEFATDPGDGSLFTVNNPYDDLGIAFTPVSAATPVLPADVLAGVGDLAKGFSLVYSGNLPTVSDTILSDSFWSVKNTDGSNRFDRVAYVLALDHPTYGRQWVWAAFEPPFTDRTKLAVPITSKRMCFQRRVSHLTVRASANANVTSVDDVSTGNIEWYPNDYNSALPTANAFDRGYMGDGTKYDFDDSNTGSDGTFFGNTGGYGSFQVHNFGLNQTLFAINHFGRTGYKPCIGIGNKPAEATNLDWTFTENADQYTVRELYILTRDVTPVTEATSAQVAEGTLRLPSGGVTRPVPADIRAKVGSVASDYDVVYASAVPTTAATIVSGTAYSVDNSNDATPYDRVAYYLELAHPTYGNQWIWVSFDRHTTDRKKLGYPSQTGNLFTWQQKVNNMNVVCSGVLGVTNYAASATGNLEIWPSNYTSTSVPSLGLGGNGGTYDFDDLINVATNSAGHGCFQIHNWGDKTTLISISHLGASGSTLGVGIGNNPQTGNNDPDYTFTYNAGNYTVRNLYVCVRPSVLNAGDTLAQVDLTIAAGATLNLDGGTQAVHSVVGTGTISNGVLAAGVILSPAGDGVVGTLGLSGITLAPGTQYRADLGDMLDVTGSLDVTGMVLHINNPESLVRSQTYTLIQTTSGVTGALPAPDTPLPPGWRVVRRGNALQLIADGGTIIMFK